MKYAGIDGCKYGWCLVLSEHGTLRFGGLYRTITELLEAHSDLDRVLIDMPMGLSSKNRLRTIETTMRKELSKRASTVFGVPCRESLKASSYVEASTVNQQIVGKKLSKQTYYISPKIREIDVFLAQNPIYKNILIESHPEICFKYLNHQIVWSKKSTPEGIEERLQILEQYDATIRTLFDEMVKNSKRKNLKRDDIVDAICLCLVNQLAGKQEMRFIEDKIEKDEKEIKIRIGFYEGRKK